MLHRGRLLVGLVTLLLIGCAEPATSEPLFTRVAAVPGEAVVYHYRIDERRNSGAALDLFANGMRFTRLDPQTFHAQRLQPGQYEFSSRIAEAGLRRVLDDTGDLTLREQELGIVVDVEPGNEYFLRWLVQSPPPPSQLEPVSTPDVVSSTVTPENRINEPSRELPAPTNAIVSAVSAERAMREIAPLRRAR
jgi:hypothetical protein